MSQAVRLEDAVLDVFRGTTTRTRGRRAAAAAAGVSLAVVAAAMDRLGPSPDRFHRELGRGRDPLANIALE